MPEVMENPVLLRHDGERWVWSGDYSQRHLPSAAGFRWDSFGRHWWTTDDRQAAALLHFAEGADRERLRSFFEDRRATLQASRSLASDAEIPCNDGLAYLAFQRAGIAFACQRSATLIADEMGLGKTVEAIGVINAIEAIERVLIVCPSSLKLNWRNELRRWLVRKFDIGIVKGDWFPLSVEIVICNYDVLARHAQKIRAVNWDLLICDEAHYLKNPKAKRTRAVVGEKDKLTPIRADRRILMTGTPILNRPIELWPLLNYLDPGRWPNYYKFGARYCGMKRGPFGIVFEGATNLDELQETLRSTVMVRRLKRDVLTELPPKRRQIIAIERPDLAELLAEERRAWEATQGKVQAARRAVSLCGPTANPRDYAAAVETLRRAESIAFTEIAGERHAIALAKVPEVVSHLLDATEAGPVVCFVHHKDVAEKIRGAFVGRCVMVTGDHTIEERQRAVERFQSDDKIILFIGTIAAAGVGLTLTRSSHVVFGELDWTPGNITQAEDRAHRIGQAESVLVQHLVIDGSLDQRMAELLVKKQNLIDRALDEVPDVDPWAELAE